jgi:hypothetical protein
MLDLGLGPREVSAIVHEAMYPELFIEMRAKGIPERAELSSGLALLYWNR